MDESKTSAPRESGSAATMKTREGNSESRSQPGMPIPQNINKSRS